MYRTAPTKCRNEQSTANPTLVLGDCMQYASVTGNTRIKNTLFKECQGVGYAGAVYCSDFAIFSLSHVHFYACTVTPDDNSMCESAAVYAYANGDGQIKLASVSGMSASAPDAGYYMMFYASETSPRSDYDCLGVADTHLFLNSFGYGRGPITFIDGFTNITNVNSTANIHGEQSGIVMETFVPGLTCGLSLFNVIDTVGYTTTYFTGETIYELNRGNFLDNGGENLLYASNAKTRMILSECVILGNTLIHPNFANGGIHYIDCVIDPMFSYEVSESFTGNVSEGTTIDLPYERYCRMPSNDFTTCLDQYSFVSVIFTYSFACWTLDFS